MDGVVTGGPASGSNPVDVVAAVIERDGKVLIARRPEGAHLGGLWEFPGGKRQPGETQEEALGRELREELGLEVRVGPAIEAVEWGYPDRRVRLTFFRCEAEEDPRPLEGQATAWVAPGELGRYEFPPADAALIARLRGA
jgi:8-oxo-dGTP diphosphatase